MEGKEPLKSEAVWKKLQSHADNTAKKIQMRVLFEQDPKRFDKYR